MATPSSVLAWKIPWTEKPGGLWFIGSQRVRMTAHTHYKNSYFSAQQVRLVSSALGVILTFSLKFLIN